MNETFFKVWFLFCASVAVLLLIAFVVVGLHFIGKFW